MNVYGSGQSRFTAHQPLSAAYALTGSLASCGGSGLRLLSTDVLHKDSQWTAFGCRKYAAMPSYVAESCPSAGRQMVYRLPSAMSSSGPGNVCSSLPNSSYCPGEALVQSALLRQPPYTNMVTKGFYAPAPVDAELCVQHPPPRVLPARGSQSRFQQMPSTVLEPGLVPQVALASHSQAEQASKHKEAEELEAGEMSDQEEDAGSACSTIDTDGQTGVSSRQFIDLQAHLRLDKEPTLGSEEMPTIGSAEHSSGRCKPCAFIFKDGCKSGVSCKFCHLCQPGEKKKRKKERKAQKRVSSAQLQRNHW